MKFFHKSGAIFTIAILLTVVVAYFFILHNKTKDRKIEVETKLTLIKEGKTFTLSQINLTDNWDSALVIAPYNMDGADRIKMGQAIKSNIKRMALGDEGNCTLVFTKGGELVSYAFVPRTNCADFSKLNNIQIYRDEKLCLTRDRVVKKE
ncbi:MAG: hypothetical protein QM654_03825 [Dysgonamonadaceae bacterium]